jgi:hypothetical protein
MSSPDLAMRRSRFAKDGYAAAVPSGETAPRARPFVAQLLSHPTACRALALLAAAQIGLVAAGLSAWPCPIRAATGFPCPGCGLTHATVALLRGEWREMLALNPVAPAVVLGTALIVAAAVLPAGSRTVLVDLVARVERRTRLPAVLLGVMVVAWILRLV